MILGKKLQNLLKDLEEKNKEGGYWNIPRETGEYLCNLILEYKPKTIVEVGASNGYSTIWLALAAEDIGAHITTFEFDPKKVGEWAHNLKKAGLLQYCDIIPDNATERLGELDAPIDFIFLDARKSDYLIHFKLLEPKLSERAIIAADNIISHAKSLQDYLEYARNHKDFESKLIKIGTGIEITRKI